MLQTFILEETQEMKFSETSYGCLGQQLFSA